MNIGILTFYKVRNLGACLQATAMQRILEKYGHHVSFLKGYDAAFSRQLFKNDTGPVRPWVIPFLIQKEYKFRNYFKSYAEATLQESEKMDGVIIGSDSLWFADYGKVPMPVAFFGDVNCKVVCTYAPSVGGKYDLRKYTDEQRKSLRKIKYITVRDDMSREFIKEITGKDCPVVLDPTLLYDWSEHLKYIGNAANKCNYILTYGGFDKKSINVINQFARRENLQVINVGTFSRHFKRNIAVSPNEFISYINNAKYVITSMFHGAMLSIALGKEFRYLAREPNRNVKVSTTLNSLHLNEVMIKKEDLWKCSNIFSDKIDYAKTNALLDGLRKASGKELEKMLGMMQPEKA